MSTTTPLPTSAARPSSRPGSRPTTPLRRSNSRSGARQLSNESFPLNALEPQFAELSDAMATLEANFHDLREMHDSISRFNENFSAFLYGLNLNAYCVDFPEAPAGPESYARVARKEAENRDEEGPGGLC
ncbi:DASH complex subunit Dam1-domain-containing protein [Sphaerosporella brunnea]|uniref:DASH complex subunit DAM1 n=1 Tax=Sphaerosporella brunnea TaxID=1250544 RepID=A0A5J5EY26_9PEZI|nr:DASH complex subunit Dam1-domain-containing protein [Sphaerosporella brunnea]